MPEYKFPNLISEQAQISPRAVLKEPVRLGEVVLEQCTIGRWSYLGSGSRVGSKTTIGAYCSIAQGVKIAPADHPMTALSTHPFQYDTKLFKGIPGYFTRDKLQKPPRSTTKIGNDVWIGANATVVAGVRIGTGAVIGASSVVTKNVEPYTIVAGIPARVIGHRFPDDIIERLLKTEWWRWAPKNFKGIAWDQAEIGIDQLEERVAALKEKKEQRLMNDLQPAPVSAQPAQEGVINDGQTNV